MIKENTVFILGAGASKPYGYPTGEQLRHDIYSSFPNKLNHLVTGGVVFSDNNPDIVSDSLTFAQTFKNSGIKSIDRFVAINNELSDLGKMAITMCILEIEQKSSFRDGLEDNWYYYLYNRMIDGCTNSDSYELFGDNKVTFITFNYDRSLEHYLFEHLKNLFYKVSKEEIVKQLQRIPIYHVYGRVGDLPWQGGDKRYGFKYSYENVCNIKDRIKIIFDRTGPEIDSIKSAIESAKQVFFLGFGYDETNMKAIGLPGVVAHGPRILGTALQATAKEIGDVKKFLENQPTRVSHQISIVDCRCIDLLRQFL